MSKIFWDTNLFIYLFEQNKEFSQKTIELRRRMLERGDILLTSSLTLGEVQVLPRKTGNSELALKYKNAIRMAARVISFGDDAADKYAEILAAGGVRGPDAIQLACAASTGVDLFVTNDQKLHRLHVPGVHFITSIDRAPIL